MSDLQDRMRAVSDSAPRPQRGHAARENINTEAYWNMTHDRWDREGTFKVITEQRRGGPWPVVLEQVPTTGQFLEVGCSAGFFLAYLHEHRPALEIDGVDLSETAIGFARDAVPEATFWKANGEKLPFSDQSFDVVYSGHFVEHMLDPVVALTEQRRLLRPGGKVIVHFPHGDKAYVEHVHDNVRFLDVRDWMKIAGFTDIDQAPLINGPAVDEGVMWGIVA